MHPLKNNSLLTAEYNLFFALGKSFLILIVFFLYPGPMPGELEGGRDSTHLHISMNRLMGRLARPGQESETLVTCQAGGSRERLPPA